MREKKQSVINRRHFLSGLIALGIAPELLINLATAKQEKPRELWVSAQGRNSRKYGVSWAASSNNNVVTTLSGFRGHGVAQHPQRKSSVVMFGRRPSKQMIEVNLISGELINNVECSEKRYLFGHGCFSRDGKYLFTTESEPRTGLGKIGVRQASNYRLVDEFESYGIGPHEIKSMPDGNTLVVANGGILTRPETGRKKLNLETMMSNLTYLDIKSGRKLEQVSVAESKASIRHLDVAADGTVAIAMQMQRQSAGHNQLVPLVATHRQGQQIALLDAPENIVNSMNDYVGSVAINNLSRTAGFASPKGNLAAFWHIDSGKFLGYHQLRDVCGISCTGDQKHFVISSSVGQLRFIDADSLKENPTRRITSNHMRWDNHLTTVIY